MSGSSSASGAASASGTPKKLVEGSNIHHDAAGRALCSASAKLCKQKRLEGFAFCVKHILEDPTAPFKRCDFVIEKKKQQCSNAIPLSDPDPRYCKSHKQVLGLAPKTIRKKKGESDSQTGESPAPSIPSTPEHDPNYYTKQLPASLSQDLFGGDSIPGTPVRPTDSAPGTPAPATPAAPKQIIIDEMSISDSDEELFVDETDADIDWLVGLSPEEILPPDEAPRADDDADEFLRKRRVQIERLVKMHRVEARQAQYQLFTAQVMSLDERRKLIEELSGPHNRWTQEKEVKKDKFAEMLARAEAEAEARDAVEESPSTNKRRKRPALITRAVESSEDEDQDAPSDSADGNGDDFEAPKPAPKRAPRREKKVASVSVAVAEEFDEDGISKGKRGRPPKPTRADGFPDDLEGAIGEPEPFEEIVDGIKVQRWRHFFAPNEIVITDSPEVPPAPIRRRGRPKRGESIITDLTSNTPVTVVLPQGDCAFDGCGETSIPLSSYCFNHILSDTKQVMFGGCEYYVDGGRKCNFPVPKHGNSNFCVAHTEAAQKNEARAQRHAAHEETAAKPEKKTRGKRTKAAAATATSEDADTPKKRKKPEPNGEEDSTPAESQPPQSKRKKRGEKATDSASTLDPEPALQQQPAATLIPQQATATFAATAGAGVPYAGQQLHPQHQMQMQMLQQQQLMQNQMAFPGGYVPVQYSQYSQFPIPGSVVPMAYAPQMPQQQMGGQPTNGTGK